MIGVAPPDMQAAIAQARAAAAERAASAQPAPEAAPAQVTAPAQPAATAQPAPAPQVSKAPPSQLKGTMIGVAPPDMQAAIAQAKAAASQRAQGTVPSDPAPAATSTSTDPMLKTMSFGDAGLPAPGATAPMAAEVEAPKSEVNPLGGTLVATSPFADPALASAIAAEAQKLATKAAAQVTSTTFDDHTPPADPPPAASQGSSPRLDESGAHRSGFPPEALDERAPVAKSSVPTSNNTLPLVLLVGAIVIVVVLLALALRSGDGEAPEEPKAAPAATE